MAKDKVVTSIIEIQVVDEPVYQCDVFGDSCTVVFNDLYLNGTIQVIARLFPNEPIRPFSSKVTANFNLAGTSAFPNDPVRCYISTNSDSLFPNDPIIPSFHSLLIQLPTGSPCTPGVTPEISAPQAAILYPLAVDLDLTFNPTTGMLTDASINSLSVLVAGN